MPTNISQVTFFIILTTILVFFLALLAIALLVLFQKRRLVYEARMNEMKFNFERNLLKTQMEIQEQTFQNISREIHDNISLSLTLAKLNLNTLDWQEPVASYHSVRSTVDIIGSAIEDLSSLSKSMNTEVIRSVGLMNAIRIEVDRISKVTSLDVHYAVEGEPIFMDAEKELVVFRIIQEAFNNILKHACATRVWLTIDYNLRHLDVLIRDNGVGFTHNTEDLKRKLSAGLRNMQTRAKLFGGNVIIESRRNSGTSILLTVPYQDYGRTD